MSIEYQLLEFHNTDNYFTVVPSGYVVVKSGIGRNWNENFSAETKLRLYYLPSTMLLQTASTVRVEVSTCSMQECM